MRCAYIATSGFIVAVLSPLACTKEPDLPPMIVETVATDLVADLGKATIAWQNRSAPVAGGLLFTGAKRLQGVEKGGERPALLAAPPSQVQFELRPKAGEHLGFGAGLSLDWPKGATGSIRFRAKIGDETIFDRTLDHSSPTSGDWADADVDLSRFAGRNIAVTFDTSTDATDATTPLPAGWGSPRIFHRESVRRTKPSRSKPNVLFVVIDTLRTDAVHAYGSAFDATPAIDALARRGLLYENAFSAAPWTWPATASILTGLYPYSHGVRRAEQCYLADSILTLAEHCQAHRITTAAFSANSMVCRAQNFSQGFETFEEFFTFGQRATPVAQAFEKWLDGMHEARFFAYVHLMDPHYPYAPPPECLDRLRGDRRSAEDDEIFEKIAKARSELVIRSMKSSKDWLRIAYEAEVLEADTAVGLMVSAIQQRGLGEETIVIVTSDHGEEFFDHGNVGHARTLYDELLHVPLVVADPRNGGGKRIPELVETVQLFATVCEAADLPVPPGLARPALPPLARRPDPFAFATTEKGETEDPFFRNQNSIRSAQWKLVYWPAVKGPEPSGEHADPSRSDRARELLERLKKWMDETTARGPKNQLGTSAAILEKLRALGYLGEGRRPPTTTSIYSPISGPGAIVLPEVVRLFDLAADPGEQTNLLASPGSPPPK